MVFQVVFPTCGRDSTTTMANKTPPLLFFLREVHTYRA
jgi:hypothetical protein